MAMAIVIADRPLTIPRDAAFFEALSVLNSDIPMCHKIKRDDCWRARIGLSFWIEHKSILEQAGFRETWIQT